MDKKSPQMFSIEDSLALGDLAGETKVKTIIDNPIIPSEEVEIKVSDKTYIYLYDNTLGPRSIDLENATGEEFLAWTNSVLPLPIDAAMPKGHFSSYKRRLVGWINIVKAHEHRFLFGQGSPRNRPSA
jgi:hypothetical protein